MSTGTNSSKPQRKPENMTKTGAAWPSVRAISAAFDSTTANAQPVLKQPTDASTRSSTLGRSASAGSVVAATREDASARPMARQQPKAQTQTPMRTPRLVKPTKEPVAIDGSSAERHSSGNANTEISAEYLQWLMIEARSKMVFDEAKVAADEELGRLELQAEEEKQKLLDEQRKLKLVRELVALDKWLSKNRKPLEDMREQVGRASEPYLQFGKSLELTTRTMPISDVYFSDTDALVNDMQRYKDAIESHFPSESSQVKNLFAAADYLSKLGKLRRQEQELLSECCRLRESLEHSAALVASHQAGKRSETQMQ
ncbi:hypothetical protein J3B02_000058 [Coemansia erecta]|nr:hypothetical protein J3B02_000058 [Coemansia erecta]